MLDLVNKAQNEVASIDSYFFRKKPDPYLVTTATTFEYTISLPARRVAKVYQLATGTTYAYMNYNGYDGRYGYKQPYAENMLGSPVIICPVDTQECASPDTASCKVIFDAGADPGTTTTIYYLERYDWPTQLSSESVSIAIPEAFQTSLLYYKVLRFLEEQEYHNSIYNIEREKKALEDWIRFANRGSRSGVVATVPRDI